MDVDHYCLEFNHNEVYLQSPGILFVLHLPLLLFMSLPFRINLIKLTSDYIKRAVLAIERCLSIIVVI